MTAAQKRAAEQAKAKLEAMLSSGVKVIALENNDNQQTKPKKIVYSNKKKKPSNIKNNTESVSKTEEVKESWDASDNEEVKDAWDASDESDKDGETVNLNAK